MNVNKLRGKIVENDLSIEKLSDLMSVDRTTIYRKLNNQGETFTVKEVRQLIHILKLSDEEIMSIFFDNIVA